MGEDAKAAPRRVLLVAARSESAPFLHEALSLPDCDVTTTSDREAREVLRTGPRFDALIVDTTGGDEGGLGPVRRLAALDYPAPILTLVPPDGGKVARAALQLGVEACVLRAAGYGAQLRWSLDAAIAHAPSGRAQHHLHTALEEATRQRHLLSERLRSTLRHLHEGVLIADARAQTLVSANAAAERLFGSPFVPDTPLDERATYRLHDRTGRPLRPEEEPIRRVAASGEARIGERLLIERADGFRVAVIVSTIPLLDSDDAVQGVVSIYQELTDQAHIQLMRDEVLSIASHELRTPLTVILGYSSLLRTLPAIRDDERMRRAVTKVYEQSLRMRELIEQLLDFSRITLGRLQLQWHEFDLKALVREVGEQQQAEAQPQPLRLALPDEPLAVTGDYNRLTQALQQVIRAARQSAQSEVVIALHTGTPASFHRIGIALPVEAERRYALISVGYDDLPRHAPPFTDGAAPHDAVRSVLAPDKALELTVSAELVRLHGGALLIEHLPSQGDVFSLLLPLQAAATA